MEDRTPRSLDSEWQKISEGKNASDRHMFYLGAAAAQSLVRDCFKRALANRRDGERENGTAAALINDIRKCLLDITECGNDVMSDLQADLVKQMAALPDNAKILEMRRQLAELANATPKNPHPE
jgi:hypothetical protein